MEEKDCPVVQMLGMVSGKWKIQIIGMIMMGKTLRYNEISAKLPKISDKTLSQRLRELEEDGLVSRIAYREIPPRVEYTLTETGVELARALVELRKVGEKLNRVDMSECENCKAFEHYPE
ncbi:MAG: helix-turn-helix domain-containing protein [Lachnospiraceae bacterium]|nr:helix-turn-helix domain-containing protein [Lachnospiraceae bacterium]